MNNSIRAWALAAAVAALCAVVRGIDFHSDQAARCAEEHWGEIREIVNPKLSMMNTMLPKSGVEKVNKLLGGAKELPEKPPSRDWLGQAADAIPAPLMDMFGKDIIEKCEKQHRR
ncbi:hypothetical protein H4R18_000709 [Coemansia javaensis]|uniref:Uncharacterized protein n=1 Tax=Coemansia javaensis TaxID=2761396 RepID=A0A9W8HHH4_9FUNG|nr:hypothetical protein H4R18_000709 [Coemansia javaensis]